MEINRKYDPIKESRGWYFVEYHPPKSDSKYAVLHLVIMENASLDKIASAMETELKVFLNRYPIPILVFSFDSKGDSYNLGQVRTSNHLIGFLSEDGQIQLHWQLLKDDEIPNRALDQEYVDKIYSGLTYKTYAEMATEQKKKRKQIKAGWVIIFIWLVVIPALLAIFEYYSNFLSLLALIYSLYLAVKKSLELMGKWPKSKKAKEKEQEERLKDHYYYHCKMNPEGFRRLMVENLEKMSTSDIAKEADMLKNNKA